MKPTRIIINTGLARCGTTATEMLFRDLPCFSTPRGVKELKFFLRQDRPEDYVRYFDTEHDNALFESSPPYMQNGVETFDQILARLSAFRDAGFDVNILVHARNLIKRAFSHYWHDINSHYAIYGKLWKVNSDSDPRRLKSLYRRSFESELSNPENDEKFLPPLGQMLLKACDILGPGKVRVIHTYALDDGVNRFVREFTANPDAAPVATPRISGAASPVYLFGGTAGTRLFIANGEEGQIPVDIPGGVCLLFARRHQEVLRAVDHDLEQITSAAALWSRSVETSALSRRVQDYLDTQRELLLQVPKGCFLVDEPDAMIDALVQMPGAMHIRPLSPTPRAVQKLLQTLHG